MTRRQSECLRNLDDSLKVLSLLTIKSCGLVLLFYAFTVLLELVFGLWTLVLGSWSFVGQIAAALIVATGLAYAERHDDEHLVPSAIRYFVSRPGRVLYGGARNDDYRGHPIEAVLRGGPWER